MPCRDAVARLLTLLFANSAKKTGKAFLPLLKSDGDDNTAEGELSEDVDYRLPLSKHILLTACLYGATFGLFLAFRSLDVIMTVAGATVGIAIMYAFPFLFCWGEMGFAWTAGGIACVVAAASTVALGLAVLALML